MTQIKLRRDTSAAFASSNPILGNGEPAYETDTKKLKIGDGTTAYTQLEYFSAGGSTDISATLPLKIVNGVISIEVDGQTIQVVDGKLAASTNMVTTNTTQTITGNKTFRYIGINDAYGGKTRLGDGQSKIEMAYDGQISLDSATILADQSQNWRVGRYNKAGLIYSAGPLKRVGDGPTFTNYDILDSSNLGNHVDGSTITYADGKLKATFVGVEVCDIGMSLYIDEEKWLRRYLNGQILDRNKKTEAFFTRLQRITTLHPSLLCTEEEWQTAKTMSAFGQVGKFVFNYSGENIVSVRLPRVVNVQGLFDLQNLGMTVAESLPNIKSSSPNNGWFLTSDNLQQTGAIQSNRIGDWTTTSGTGSLDMTAISFNANDSSPTYQDNAHVQQEAIQYPYFIQIATGSETENNIVNDIELNNPYSLFDSKYSDHELNNLSWTRGDTFDWKPSATYPSAYNELLSEYNNSESVEETEGDITFKRTPKGYKIALADQETAIASKYETYGIAWYYLLDTANTQFKLPRTQYGFKGIRDNVGDYIAESLPNITGSLGQFVHGAQSAQSTTGAFKTTYNSVSGSVNGAGISYDETSFDASRSSSTYQDGAPVQERATQMYLYFYVGETVQNANLIDAGRIGEQLANKQDKCVHITETYQNGYSWYRVYSDGWCEQGGKNNSGNRKAIVKLLKAFANINYTASASLIGTDGAYLERADATLSTFTSSSFCIDFRNMGNNSVGTPVGYFWRASGYIR